MVLLFAVLLGGCVFQGETAFPNESGPLQTGEGAGISTSGFDTEPGATVAFGLNTLTNTGASTVVLDTMSLVAETEAAAAQLADVVTTEELWAIDATYGPELFAVGPWPTDRPVGELHPLRGYVVDPESTVELVIVLRIKSAITARWSGIAVRYAYRGDTFTTTTTDGLKLCAISRGSEPCDLH